MQVVLACPRCEQTVRVEPVSPESPLRCPHCDWTRPVSAAAVEHDEPHECLACGCRDLWRQKDFPPQLGLGMVACGATLSTIAWAYMEPAWSIGILMAFALVDLLLYTYMPDVLVCYRCQARHRRTGGGERHEKFSLETFERYRQQHLRLEEAERQATGVKATRPVD